MKNIPNFFTLLNLVFGSIAIIFILQPGESIVNFNGEEWKVYLPEKIQWGAFFIFMAAVVDFLDGFVARLMKADSEMGKQLDSLADVVSFGVAPGMIMYQLLRLTFAYEPGGLETPFYNLIPALLLPAAAAWRLARFNLDPGQKFGFKGLPAPAAGLFIASIPLIMLYNQFGIQELLLNKWVLYGIIGMVSYLMVSTIPLMGLKFTNYQVKENWPKFLLIAIGLISALILQWMAVPVLFVLYILLSLLTQNKTA
ncbi:MAG TPA: CDP-alcohol phosphatidyltransferase family protein [Chitinophagaceae bacterium]|nr:CDP-alcohol phosphatidyltransferase family protein [Chitinophagaceae bacterium]